MVTLGKRQIDADEFLIPEVKKRQKRLDKGPLSVMTEDLPSDSKVNTVKGKITERMVKSAPTSANGSNNPEPILDIQVNLPVEHADQSSDESEDSDLRKEKR